LLRRRKRRGSADKDRLEQSFFTRQRTGSLWLKGARSAEYNRGVLLVEQLASAELGSAEEELGDKQSVLL
jgi:hypothetical protein